MKAARLYGAGDFRIDELPAPLAPAAGQAVIRVTAVGVCGSDLHSYVDGRIGDSVVVKPLILGHEFSGTVAAVGPDVVDGAGAPLRVGQRVAVDPAMPCWRCDRCEQGHPNLCRTLGFMGLAPDDGALQELFTVPARSCFSLPDRLSFDEGALLEPLGVALHAVDLAKIGVGEDVAVLGCGPVGLLVMRVARLAGAGRIIAFDQYPWRLEKAAAWAADEAIDIREEDPVAALLARTDGRGVPVAFEAAWAGEAVDQATRMADLGGTVILVGIPSGDEACFTHSVARRKGLTYKLVRRMKHAYPRSIPLATSGRVPLEELITHRFGLDETGRAFALNAAYGDGIIKAMIERDR